MFKPNDRVLLREKQLFGNMNGVVSGEIVSLQGDSARVVIDGDDRVKTVPVSSLQSAEGMTLRPNELPIENALRR